MKKHVMTSLMGIVLTSGLAYAATTTQTQTINVSSHNPKLIQDMFFDKFDSADTALEQNKTLTQVTVTSNLEWWGGYYAVDNESENPSSGTAVFGAAFTITTTDVRGIPAGTSDLSGAIETPLNLTANDGDDPNEYNSGGPDHARIDGPVYADRKSVTGSGNVAESFISDYAGVGTFKITYTSEQSQSWDGVGGNSTSSGPVSAQGYVMVTYTYDYDPIPEPASLALLGLGAAVLGLRRRVRKVA